MDDKITIERINTLHPKIRQNVLDVYRKANSKLGNGVRLRYSYTTRTDEEQNALYALGRTKVNPDGRSAKKPMGNIVTNAKAGQSIHNYSLAWDIVLLYDKNRDGNFEEVSWSMVRDEDKDGIADWLEVTKVMLDAGYTNGFITNGKKWDFPHFQKDFGLHWKQMKVKMDKGDYFTEVINGRTYKYINL